MKKILKRACLWIGRKFIQFGMSPQEARTLQITITEEERDCLIKQFRDSGGKFESV